MERRNGPKTPGVSRPVIATSLPLDYIKSVIQVFTTHFDASLKALKKDRTKARFAASGKIYPDELTLTVSIIEEGVLSATSVHASSDFDPTASRPTAEELLGGCVDAIASLFSEMIPADDPKKLADVITQPLSAFEDIPFVWTPMAVNQRQVFLMVDKTNPDLENLTEEWLEKNDPKLREAQAAESEEAEELLAERVSVKTQRGKKPDPTRH